MLSSTLNKSQQSGYNDPIQSGSNPFAWESEYVEVPKPVYTGQAPRPGTTPSNDYGGILWLLLGLM